jgi:DNA-binding transcriptional regulator LsrR (DeoR family)
MARGGTKRDVDDSLAIRAAWLHYAAGLTQVEVAERLGVSSVKAHRLISWAYQNGAVKVSIVGDIADCILLESAMAERFGLASCEVVPDLYEDGLPLRALGAAGSAFLGRQIDRLKSGIIGLGHGRTLAAAVADMPRTDPGAVRFVSLTGGLTRNYAANPHDVMHRLAEKTGAAAYVMPIPFFANSAGDREILRDQRGVSDIFDLALSADLMFIGLGTVQPDAQLVSSQMISTDEIEEVRERGGVGEMLGHFFDEAGRPVETSLTARTVSLGLEQLSGRRIVALAGGASKIAAMRSVLNSGYLKGLITDERSAKALMEDRTP